MMNNKKGRENKKARVVWSIQLHQKFLNAVNQLGIEDAIPRKILELMNDKNLTRQHVASHLQKYKLHLKRSSSSAANQQHDYDIGPSFPCAQDAQELPSSGTNYSGQNHNTHADSFHNVVELTPIISDDLPEWLCNQSMDLLTNCQVTSDVPSKWSDVLNEDNARCHSNVASSSCNQCSQVLDEIAKFRQEMAATKDENRQLREIIQAMKAQQEILMQAVLQVVPPPSHISLSHRECAPTSHDNEWITNFLDTL